MGSRSAPPNDRPGPAAVIVPGAWQVPEHYADLVSSCRAAGFVTEQPRLSTSMMGQLSVCSRAEDVVRVRAVLARLADDGHPIIVFMHSYGANVGSDAAYGLSWTERRKTQLRGGIVHLIWMGALVVPPGESAMSIMCPGIQEGSAPDFMIEGREAGGVVLPNADQVLYGDLAEKERDHWTRLCVPFPIAALWERVQHAPYGPQGIDSTWIVCEKDVNASMEVQEERGRSLSATTRLVYVDAGHCAHLGKRTEIVRLIRDVWQVSKAHAEC